MKARQRKQYLGISEVMVYTESWSFQVQVFATRRATGELHVDAEDAPSRTLVDAEGEAAFR